MVYYVTIHDDNIAYLAKSNFPEGRTLSKDDFVLISTDKSPSEWTLSWLDSKEWSSIIIYNNEVEYSDVIDVDNIPIGIKPVKKSVFMGKPIFPMNLPINPIKTPLLFQSA